jgi:hypothetical protein
MPTTKPLTDTFTDPNRTAQQLVRSLIWWFYADLKAYRAEPTPCRRSELRARFDRIFRRRTLPPSIACCSGCMPTNPNC